MKVVGVLLVTLFVSCLASDKLDLDSLEKELMAAPLVDIEPGTSYKFFDWFKKACKCKGIQCSCCASPRIFGASIQGCIQFTLTPEQKLLEIELTALNKKVFKHPFPTQNVEIICGQLPGIASFLGYCFKSEVLGNEKDGVKFCSSLDVKVKTVTAVSVTFRCVKLQNDKLSLEENNSDMGEGVFKVKARNPLKKVVDWIKNKKN